MKIKKGDSFLCIKDYIMDDDTVAYKSGKHYVSEVDGCLTDEIFDTWHRMQVDSEFLEHFSYEF